MKAPQYPPLPPRSAGATSIRHGISEMLPTCPMRTTKQKEFGEVAMSFWVSLAARIHDQELVFMAREMYIFFVLRKCNF